MTISAKVVKDSITDAGIRLTTMELRYPRFIHSELMTHRQFSRNASSSRAVPIEKMIEEVETDPAMPVRWGLNGRGMQDHGELSEIAAQRVRSEWLKARDNAVNTARKMIGNNEPPHKQIVNRILEPFSHITVLVSATEWDNFYSLRYHDPGAPDPTMFALATAMWSAHQQSTPALRTFGDWHLPYICDGDIEAACLYAFDHLKANTLTVEDLDREATTLCCKMSVARCARVSYLNHDKTTPSIEKDLETYKKLIMSNPLHASPAEHLATPDRIVNHAIGVAGWEVPQLHGNFVGWSQYRKMLIGESVETNSRMVSDVLSKRQNYKDSAHGSRSVSL